MTKENPLNPRGTALEEEHFRKQDADLIARLKKLDGAITKFVAQHWKADSGITGVVSAGGAIKVYVTDLAAAGKLPATFDGFNVTVYQNLDEAGEKVIVRDGKGKVVGAQG